MKKLKILKKVTAFLVITALVMGLCSLTAFAAPTDAAVTLESNPELYNALINYVPELDPDRTGIITQGEMEPIEHLWLSDSGIKSIDGLQYCVNIRELVLYNNQITDISPVASMQCLEMLWVDDNQIKDISPAAATPAYYLTFNHNLVSDLSGFEGRVYDAFDCRNNYLNLSPDNEDYQILSTMLFDGEIAEQNLLSVNYDAGTLGTAARTSDEGLYYESSVTLPEVTASSGYTFAGWDVNGDGTADAQAGESVVVAPQLPLDNNTVTYTAVYTSASSSGKLSAINTSCGTLQPSFDADTLKYTLTVPKHTKSIVITPIKASESDTMYIDGKKVESKTVKISCGSKVVKIKLVTETGKKTVYVIKIKASK